MHQKTTQTLSYGDGDLGLWPHETDRRSPGSNLRPLVYKASDLTTAPRRLLPSVGHVYSTVLEQLSGNLTEWCQVVLEQDTVQLPIILVAIIIQVVALS